MKALLKIAVVFLLWSCAQQAPLTGGDKDTVPPKIIEFKTNPKNLSTNFQSNTVKVEFNEYIKLKNTSKNFFVNPPIQNIDVKAANKTVLISINEKLKNQTTYTFNFGNAIEDITEGNVLEDFKYVISTGAFIDSNFFNGFAYDAFSKKPIEKTKVLLFENEIDTLNDEAIPNYFSMAKEDGSFALENLKESPFFLVAFEDENENNSYDSKTERIGFINSQIVPLNKQDSSSKVPSLVLFSEEKKLKLIDKKYLFPGKILLLFNQKTDAVNVSSMDKTLFQMVRNQPSDSVEFWIDSITTKLQTFKISSPLLDSTRSISIPTLAPKVVESIFTFKVKNLSNLKPNRPLQLQFNHPILSVDSQKINLSKDSIFYPLNFEYTDNIFFLYLPDNKSESFKLSALPGAFNSIYGFTNDSTTIKIQPKSKSDYGSIYFSVSVSDASNFICQVLKNEKIVESFYSTNHSLKGSSTMCLPGNYNLRIIKDTDKNRKFTTGNFIKKKQPEQVIYYNEPIEIKAGWDVEVNWEIK